MVGNKRNLVVVNVWLEEKKRERDAGRKRRIKKMRSLF